MTTESQGLILVHLSAQLEHFLWDTLGCFGVSMTKPALILKVDECKPLPRVSAPSSSCQSSTLAEQPSCRAWHTLLSFTTS